MKAVRFTEHARDNWQDVFWNELKSNDVDAMIDELVRYKEQHYPDDRRRILVCGIPDGDMRVEWLHPAAPGVDSQ